MAVRTSQIHTEASGRVQQYEERLNQLVFELQSAKNENLSLSNGYDSELHQLRLAQERAQAEQNTLRIQIDRLQQQLRDAEDELGQARRELAAALDRHARECEQLRADAQYKAQHHESLIREIKQSSAQEEAVRIKAELAERLSQQYEERIAGLRAELGQQEAQRTLGLREEAEARLKQYLGQIAELHAQVEGYQRQIHEMGQLSSSTKNEQSWQIMHLQQRFKEVNEGLSQTEKFYQARIDQLTQDLAAKARELDTRLQEVRAEEALRHEKLIERIKASEAKGYSGELARLGEEYEALSRRQHRQYEESATLIKAGLEQKIGEVSADLQARLALSEERARELDKAKAELERQLARLQSDSQNKYAQYEVVAAQLREQEELLRRRAHEDRDFEDSTALIVADLQAKLHRIEIRAQELESQLLSERKAAELVRSGQGEVEKKTMQMVESLKKEMAEAHAAASDLRMRNHVLEADLDKLRRELDVSREKQGSEATVESRRQDLSKAEEKNRIIVEQREEIQGLLHRYDKLRLEMSAREDKHYDQVRSLKDIAFALEKETIELNSRTQLLEIRAEELRIENRQLKEQLRVASQLRHVASVSRIAEVQKPSTAKTDYTFSVRPPETPLAEAVNRRGDKEALGNSLSSSIHVLGGRTTSPPATNLRILSNNLAAQKPQSPQNHLVLPQGNPADEYRLNTAPRKSTVVENVVRIEKKDDSIDRLRRQNEAPTTTLRNQSPHSPPERKITVTYDTTKRASNQSVFSNNTVVKPGNASGPIEVVTKITTHSPRNRSGSRERPKIIQIGGNTRPSGQFSSPPPRLEIPTTKALAPTQLAFVSPAKPFNDTKEVRRPEGLREETSFFERDTYFLENKASEN